MIRIPDTIMNINMPLVKKLFYNVGSKTVIIGKDKDKDIKKAYPTLTTIVFWTDGTKTVVTNCYTDPVTFEDDGVTPTQQSKEHGLLYAIVKRMCTKVRYTENAEGDRVIKTADSSGFTRMLRDLVNSAGIQTRGEFKDDAKAKDKPPKKLPEGQAAKVCRCKKSSCDSAPACPDFEPKDNAKLIESLAELKKTYDTFFKALESLSFFSAK